MNTATATAPIIDDTKIRSLGHEAQAATPVPGQEREKLINKIKN